jgi:dienelactone hydrolase
VFNLAVVPQIAEVPAYNPDSCPNIKAVTFDGLSVNGMKTKVFAYIGYPKKSGGTNKCPAIVLVHGGGGHAFFEWVRIWNEAGYAAIAMDTTGFYPKAKNAGYKDGDAENWVYGIKGNPDFYEEGYTDAPNNDGMKTSAEPLETQWMTHAINDTIIAHNILRNDDSIDNTKIGLTGISWGGVITSLAIGIDTGYAFAIPIFGSGYLGEGLGYIYDCFKDKATQELWLAEKNFGKVDFPVLWFCWNDDTSFSINSNSKSYHDTVKNNPRTLLSMKDGMYHSHYHGWIWGENYLFADSVISGDFKFPRFLNQPQGLDITCDLNIPDGITVTAKIYYITSQMKYTKRDKHNARDGWYMEQDWEKIDVNIENNAVKYTLPDSVKGYYVELLFKTDDGYGFTSTSEYIII